MKRFLRAAASPAAVAITAMLIGCGTTGSSSSGASTAANPAAAPVPAKKSMAGMNERGEVVDSSKVEAGSGVRVKGIGEWEGEITGKPGPGSKFTKLQIGMGMKQATDIAGQPTDQGGYVTGKAWIPFFFGADKYRHEMVFKGHGRLIFAAPGGFDVSAGNLIWIIHNPNEPGYR